MGAGPLNKPKIGFIIQARLKSERLPGKVLLPLPFPDGKSMLELIINQIRGLSHPVIVATSTLPENDLLEQFCRENNIECFRGSENNVLSRYTNLQKSWHFDHIVRLTADNPFIDLETLSDFIDFHVDGGYDYSSSRGLPLGMNFEIFKGEALLSSEEFVIGDGDTEHVTKALKRESCFSIGDFYVPSGLESIRLTVDTVQDYMTASLLKSLGDKKNLSAGLELVKYAASSYPWIFTGNCEIYQKNQAHDLEGEITSAEMVLRKLEYHKVADILKDIMP